MRIVFLVGDDVKGNGGDAVEEEGVDGASELAGGGEVGALVFI